MLVTCMLRKDGPESMDKGEGVGEGDGGRYLLK